MASKPHKQRLLWFLALAEGLMCSGGAVSHAQPAPTPRANPATAAAPVNSNLYLETTLNGTDRGLMRFRFLGDSLWADVETLRELGFRLAADTPSPVRLESLAGVKVGYDVSRQAVALTVPLALLDMPTQMIGGAPGPAPTPNTTPGALLNYTLYGTQGERATTTASAFTELRAFNNAGVLSSTQLSQVARAGTEGDWATQSVRLDTSWTSSFPDSALSLRVGDTLTAATTWSRATRIGGLQFGTNYALQPYRVTTPLPQFLGAATLPSQVELFVNGMKQYTGEVPAGPFQLNAVPGINGAGNAQVVVTDALGRATTLNFSLYNTPELLQEGLSDWSTELGVVRRNYGFESFSYGSDPVASGTWRHGVTNGFTAEVHAEASRDLANAGVGGAWLLGQKGGVLSGSVAHSQSDGLSGSQYGVGYSWSDTRFFASASGIRADAGYRDVATFYGAPPPQISASAQAGFNTALMGSFSLGYVHLRDTLQTSRYGTFNWSISLGRNLFASFNVNQNLDLNSDRSVFLNINLALDDIFTGASVQHSGGRNLFSANASLTTPQEGGWGWRAQAQQGDDTHSAQGEIDYLGRYGLVQAGLSNIGGNTTGFASATGSLVLMEGHVKAARNITNGFAVVSTDGVPDVPVKLQNNVVGTTDRDGLLLVTPLNPYQNNKLSIDPMDLPPDVRIAKVDANATPADRAGALVRFGITPVRAATIVLVDAQGKPLPVGSQARLQGSSDAPAFVGFDGLVYLDNLAPRNMLEVAGAKGSRCRVAFDLPEQRGIARIGPLTCISGAAP